MDYSKYDYYKRDLNILSQDTSPDGEQVIQVTQSLEELILTKMNPLGPKSSREEFQMKIEAGLTESVKLLKLDSMNQTNQNC